MKQSGAWVLKRAMVTGLVVGVALWGAGCGGSDDSSDNDTPPATSHNRYALAVGIDHYAPSIGANSLMTCVNDANGFAGELAKDGSLWKTLPASITVWGDAEATLAAIRARLQGIASLAQPGDLVVYFHSSHGGDFGTPDAPPDAVPDSTFLVAYDAFYEDEVFAQDLAQFRDGVNVVVVLDACFSAGMYKGGPVFEFPQRVMNAYANACKAKSVKGANIGWLASSEYTETSEAGPTPQSFSRFTQYLIEAFKSGDADNSGSLTFKELFDYAKPRTQPAHNPQSLNDNVLALVAAAVDPNAPSSIGGGGGGGGGGTAVTDANSMLGTWHFMYNIGTTPFEHYYTLNTISTDLNYDGQPFIHGEGSIEGSIVCTYYPSGPNGGNWALLDPGTIIHRFFTFTTDGSVILPGSFYYQIDPDTGVFSSGYEFTGSKIHDLSAIILKNMNMDGDLKLQVHEKEVLSTDATGTTRKAPDSFIVQRYRELLDAVK